MMELFRVSSHFSRFAIPIATIGFFHMFLCIHQVCGDESSLEIQKQNEQFFETKIRPVLVENCFKCHEADKQKGGLTASSLDGLLNGGDSGPAVVPGNAEQSLLIKVISHSNDAPVQMPPDKKLSDRIIADFKTWIKQGAVWPGSTVDGTKTDGPTLRRGKAEVTEEDKDYWAFKPVRQPSLPTSKFNRQAVQPIDAFINATLESKGIEPSGQATKRELIRRAYFDLIGLPPTANEVSSFESDTSPDAFARIIDNLLSRPEYGERWARHWLDVVRYAQSNGYERDSTKNFAWRYRDYVINALNNDKPYDRFVLEQLAGDELEDSNDESLIATGFYRLGTCDDEPDDARAADFDDLDDIMVSTGATFLGLSLGCARCHNHMFDPIPQADYYSFASFFRGIRRFSNDQTIDSAGYTPIGNKEVIRSWLAEAKPRIAELRKELNELNESESKAKNNESVLDNPINFGQRRKEIDEEIKKLQRPPDGIEWAMTVKERGPNPPDTFVLTRGNPASPAQKVKPSYLQAVSITQPALLKPSVEASSSGRRLALAQWIVHPEHPLTARVMVNRIWQHHFGNGIVRTTNDFGNGGVPPSHPELLDWLASEFVSHKWSIKSLHKTIMLSDAYQRSSKDRSELAKSIDPDNTFLWRQNLRRLEAESVRDSILAVSGSLNKLAGGPGFYPHLTGESLAGGSRPGDNWVVSRGEDLKRRSIYGFVKRSMMSPGMDLFDYNITTAPVGERQTTTVAPQALLMLNDEFMQQNASAFANRLFTSSPEHGSNTSLLVRRAYSIGLNRQPTEHEEAIALEFIDLQRTEFERIRDRLTFRPDIPESLHTNYLSQLKTSEMIVGPAANWSYHKGRWTGGYEGIVSVDIDRGPFALWPGIEFDNGEVTGQLVLNNATEFCSIIVRAKLLGDVFQGYEVKFDLREQKVSLQQYSEKESKEVQGAREIQSLAESYLSIPTFKPIPFRIVLHGSQIQVFSNNDKPVLDVVVTSPDSPLGNIGVRVWGAPINIDNLTIEAVKNTSSPVSHPNPLANVSYKVASLSIDASKPLVTQPNDAQTASNLDTSNWKYASFLSTDPRPDPNQQAIQAFCLVLMNLNEFIYVD